MAAARRYAEGTTVAVSKSRADISDILEKHGCTTMMWGTQPTGDALEFHLAGHVYRFLIERPTVESLRKRDGKNYVYPHNVDWPGKVEAEWRRRWRAHVLLIKAKLEFSNDGDVTTLAREFLPYAVMSDGRTLLENVEGGGVPLLLAAGGAA
jgi:hypothetical protein